MIIVLYAPQYSSVLSRLVVVLHNRTQDPVGADSGAHQSLTEHHLSHSIEGEGNSKTYLMVQPQLASVEVQTLSKDSP